ncbi:MAG: very short patch repair endonuclease [Clostridiales Family XIII bacterium]|jgi:DNA mismatch endonuclease (patch repair protein)|nr:very short patch repair endonuclease [Clostridiales Family XIII bacterium]
MAKKPDTRTDAEKRSYTMSRIKGKSTSIEVALAKALWHRGIRYRKNYRKVPGAPDIAIVKHRIAIFCDGDFWHGRDWPRKKHQFKSNKDYWVNKIEGNIERDKRRVNELQALGWYVLRFWGDEITSDVDACVDEVFRAIDLAREEADGGAHGESKCEDLAYRASEYIPRTPLMAAEQEKECYIIEENAEHIKEE